MQSDPNTGIARYREALAVIAALRKEAPGDPRYAEWAARTTSNLGLILAGTGKIDAAITAQREAVALAEQVADKFLQLDALAMCRNNLGEMLVIAKHFPEAETIFRDSLKDYSSLEARFPEDVDYRWGVAMTLTNLAEVVIQQGRSKDARELIDESGKIFEELNKTLGTNANFQENRDKNKRIRDALRQNPDGKSR
jgi:tetratricopeptide (TPR) repeat protein